MIDINQIDQIIGQVIDVKKRLKRTSFLPGKAKDYRDEYFPGYFDFVEWKESISNHTVKGKKPYKLLETKAPNQSDQELEYVLCNYKQITLPVSFEFLSTITRGLYDGNWSIDYPEEEARYRTAEMTFKDYIEKDIASTPLKMSFDAWMKYVLPGTKINDSMGVVAYKPYREEKTVLDDHGNLVIAGDALPEPIPYYYSCDRVLSTMDDGYVLIETNRYSIVEKGGKKERAGIIFELYDDQNIYVIEQVGKQTDWQFESTVYFEHNFGFIPCKYMEGKPVYDCDGNLVWQSPFLMVSDILDEVLLDGCNLRGAKAACVYPQKVMLGNDCQFQDENHNNCRDGWILNKTGDGKYRCPECNGVGQTSRTSPLNTLYVRGTVNGQEGDGVKPADALAYISPSVDTPQFLRDEITQGILNALSILHLKTTNSVVKGSEDMTATGMVMDEKAKYAFVKSVVDQIFDHYEFGMLCMGKMRYGDDFKMPVIQRPLTYDFNSEADYLMMISTLQSVSAPPSIVAAYVYKYLKAIFYDNPKTAKAYDLIIAADRLFTMTRDQINSELPRNLIAGWEVVLHDSALTFIAELQRENKDFLDQEMDVMITQLVERAKLKTPASPQATPRLNAAAILENANA